MRKVRKDRITRDLIPCACGCGEFLESMDKRAHHRKYIGDHWRKKLTLKGKYNVNWKGGKYNHRDGYVMVYCPNHPHAVYGYVLEHRLVMEEYLGRNLELNELVHHRNGNKKDNRIENLELTTRIEHPKYHKKDMSDRFCIECGSKKTTLKYNRLYRWTRHPITKKGWVCSRCYNKLIQIRVTIRQNTYKLL